jgi:hypothetical protein
MTLLASRGVILTFDQAIALSIIVGMLVLFIWGRLTDGGDFLVGLGALLAIGCQSVRLNDQ